MAKKKVVEPVEEPEAEEVLEKEEVLLASPEHPEALEEVIEDEEKEAENPTVEAAEVEEPAPKPPEPTFKEKIERLIAEAPTMQTVMKDPWRYTEWLATLNTTVLNGD